MINGPRAVQISNALFHHFRRSAGCGPGVYSIRRRGLVGWGYNCLFAAWQKKYKQQNKKDKAAGSFWERGNLGHEEERTNAAGSATLR
jgi:hypothetical protein